MSHVGAPYNKLIKYRCQRSLRGSGMRHPDWRTHSNQGKPRCWSTWSVFLDQKKKTLWAGRHTSKAWEISEGSLAIHGPSQNLEHTLSTSSYRPRRTVTPGDRHPLESPFSFHHALALGRADTPSYHRRSASAPSGMGSFKPAVAKSTVASKVTSATEKRLPETKGTSASRALISV